MRLGRLPSRGISPRTRTLAHPVLTLSVQFVTARSIAGPADA
jgi:hypothetical protein